MVTDKKINLLMGLHCHQPVDNFKTIFEDAYKKSYEPFLSVLERHPKVKLSLHYSGSLLDWILENRPTFMKRIKALIDKKQIEILTGGYYEPILPMIPSKDAIGQIKMLTRAVEKYLSFAPCGVWLTERVWDPGLSFVFKDIGIRYTILDDFHFKQAGLVDDKVFGYYSVRNFDNFSVFASIKKLRYTMPFREVKITIDFLKTILEREDSHLITFADDCEKFGFWPHTYDWVYRRGWLEKFFTALEETSWVNTLTFSEALERFKPLGEIEIPHSSYEEMIQWCNGNFNNFFLKYPESNLLKNRMIYVSKKIEELQKEKDNDNNIKKARGELYKSQSNCVYWHGVFGGIYVNYLRNGVYSHIINAEEMLKPDDKSLDMETIELGEKRQNVILARNKFLKLFIDPDYAGSIFEVDYKPLSYNLVSTVSRHCEPYHEKIKKRRKISHRALKKKVDRNEEIDLYEVLGVKERNLERFLNYDSYHRFSLLCHIMDSNMPFQDFVKSRHIDLCENSLFGPYSHKEENSLDRLTINLERNGNVNIRGRPYSLKLNKCIILEKNAEIFIKFTLENMSTRSVKFMFGIEFNWSIEDKDFVRDRQERRIREIALLDRYCGLKVNHTFGEEMDLFSFPVYTLNETESGIGKSFQEVSLLFYRKLALASKGKFSLDSSIRISK